MSSVALVTGGSKRIGRAIVERLAGAGYAIALHFNHSMEDAEKLAGELHAGGGQVALVQADLADPGAVATLMERAHVALGPVTLLVNNASEFERDEVETLELARWQRHFAINLQAPVFLARDMARLLPETAKGSIVNIVDQRVLKLTPQFFSYTLTKSALFTATRTMAQALAPRIRVNAIGPGPTFSNPRQAPEDFAKQSTSCLLGRGPSPQELADAVLFLARAESVTGQMIAVDGGQHLAWETADVAGLNE
jgi:NAD(P)-dependent dehydrogenase (short-subunit alcohol dehydrogenase family)